MHGRCFPAQNARVEAEVGGELGGGLFVMVIDRLVQQTKKVKLI